MTKTSYIAMRKIFDAMVELKPDKAKILKVLIQAVYDEPESFDWLTEAMNYRVPRTKEEK